MTAVGLRTNPSADPDEGIPDFAADRDFAADDQDVLADFSLEVHRPAPGDELLLLAPAADDDVFFIADLRFPLGGEEGDQPRGQEDE